MVFSSYSGLAGSAHEESETREYVWRTLCRNGVGVPGMRKRVVLLPVRARRRTTVMRSSMRKKLIYEENGNVPRSAEEQQMGTVLNRFEHQTGFLIPTKFCVHPVQDEIGNHRVSESWQTYHCTNHIHVHTLRNE